MTNPLSTVRADVATGLKGVGINAFSEIPEVSTPPLAWVAPGDPYLRREGAAFGGEIVRLEIVLTAAPGANAKRAETLDQFIVTVLDALDALDLHVVDVGQPGQVVLNGQQFLAAAIAVDTEIHR